ncbi:MAG: nucleoside triphosphate pyrophosphohydrolase [Candidatus Komeilibacteria bacterium]
MIYHKLVRDRIPDIIAAKGGQAKTHIAAEAEYWLKLKEKLTEEVVEFCQAESTEEMADIQEVLNAIYEFKNFTPAAIETFRLKKAQQRGGFSQRIILDES